MEPKLIRTREIVEALDLEPEVITPELMLEREAAIEKKWLAEFEIERARLKEEYEKMATGDDLLSTYQKAVEEIGSVAQSALHVNGIVVPSLVPQVYQDGPDLEAKSEITVAILKYIKMGRDFEVMMQAVQENDVVRGEWERFVMTLGLTQV